MNLINDKVESISSGLSRVTGSLPENFSAEALASVIEGLVIAKSDEEEAEG